MSRGKGVVLISGGLDSLLTARLLMDQDLELVGFHGALPFIAPDARLDELEPVRLARQINLDVRVHRCGDEYITMLRNPKHGYGKHTNPCIDCHMYFIRKAADLMREIGADFVATGEVVGQRPMSQMRHTMTHIEKETGLKGRLLRPLSAQLLQPTIPEEEGIVDRSLLLGINGRSRSKQFELAQKYNIKEYSPPSGGCLFTDTFIAKRVRDLITVHERVTAVDIYLLTIGRHYRISGDLKIIVSRNERENIELEKYRHTAEFFFTPEFKGPSVYAKGTMRGEDIERICSVMLRYGKTEGAAPIVLMENNEGTSRQVEASGVIHDAELDTMRI